MKIIIDIPKELENKINIMGLDRIPFEEIKTVSKAITHGIKIPEHHGRLVDTNCCADCFEAARYELSNEYEDGLHEAWELVLSETAIPAILDEE